MDELHQRGKALEEIFFKARDSKLLDQLKQEMADSETREALTLVSGIHDKATLDAIMSTGISPESLTSFSLIPLVTVAWADGNVDAKERKAILEAASQAGIAFESPGYQLLNSWLDQPPGEELFDAWKQYIHALKTELSETAFNQLKSSVVERARQVADAAGGFLGLGNRISEKESKVLDDLTAAF